MEPGSGERLFIKREVFGSRQKEVRQINLEIRISFRMKIDKRL